MTKLNFRSVIWENGVFYIFKMSMLVLIFWIDITAGNRYAGCNMSKTSLMPKTEMALMTCNVSWREPLSLETLLTILDDGQELDPWIGHVSTLLNEVDPNVLTSLARENNFPVSRLADLFKRLPPVLQSPQARSFFEHGIILENKYC